MTMQGGRRPPRSRNYYNNNNSYHSEPSAQYGPSNSHTRYSNGYSSSNGGGGLDYSHGITYYDSPAGTPGVGARYMPEPPVQTTCNNNTVSPALQQDSIATSGTATMMMPAGPHAYYNNNNGSAACMLQYSAVTQEAPPQQQQSTSAPYMWQPGRHEAMAQGGCNVWPSTTTTAIAAPMTTMYNGRDDSYDSHASGRGRKVMMSHPTTTRTDHAAATTTAFAGQHTSHYNNSGVDASQAACYVPPYTTTTTMNVAGGVGALPNTVMMQPTPTEGNGPQTAAHRPAEGHYLREANAESSTHYNNKSMAQDSSTLMPFQVRDTSMTAVAVGYADHSSTSEALAQPALSMTTDTRTSLSTSTESNNNTRNGSSTRPVRSSTNNNKYNNSRSTRGVQLRDSTITCTAKDSHTMCEAKDNNSGRSTGEAIHRNAMPQHKGMMTTRRHATPFAVPYDTRTAQSTEMTWYNIPPQQQMDNITAASMAQRSERAEVAAVDMSGCCVGQEEYVMIRPHVLQLLLQQQQQQQSSSHHHSPSSPFPGPSHTLYAGPSYYDNNKVAMPHAANEELTSAIQQQQHSYGAAFIEGSTAYTTEYMDMQAQDNVYATTQTPSIAHHASIHTINPTTTTVSPQQQYQSASMAPVGQFPPSLPHERGATDSMNEAMHWSQASSLMPPPPPLQSSQLVQMPCSTIRYPEDNTTQAGSKAQRHTLTTTTTTNANVAAGRSHHERDSTCNAHADIYAAQSPMISSSTGVVPLTYNRTACPAMSSSSSFSAVTMGVDNTREATVAGAMQTPLHMADDEQTTRKNTATTIMEGQSGMNEAEMELQQQLAALQFHAMTDTSSSTPHSLLTVSSPITTTTTTTRNATVHSSHAGTTAKNGNSRHHTALQPHTQGPIVTQPADIVAATSRPATMSSTATTTMTTSSCLRPTQGSHYSSSPYNHESNNNNVYISSSGTSGLGSGGSSRHRVHISNTSGSNNNSQHCSVNKGSVTAASHTGSVHIMPSTTTAALKPSAVMAMTATNHSLITAAQPMQSSSSFSSSSPATAGAGSSSSLQLLRQPHQSNGIPQRLSSGSTSHIRSVGGASGSLPRQFFPFSSSHTASSYPITAQAPPPPSHTLHHHHNNHNSNNTALHLSSVQEPAVQKAINGTRYTIGGWYEGVVKRYNPLRGFGFVTGKFMLHYDPQHCERVCLRNAKAILAQQQQQQEEEAKAACNDEQQQKCSVDGNGEESTRQSNTGDDYGNGGMESNTVSDKAVPDKRTPTTHDKDVTEGSNDDDDVRAKAQTLVSNSNTTPNASMSSNVAATTTTRSATHLSHASATPSQDTLTTTTTTTMNAVVPDVSVAAGNNAVLVKEGEATGSGSNTEEEAERADGMVVLSTMQWYLAHTDLEGNGMSSDVHEKEEKDEEKSEVHETARRRSAGLQRTPIDIGDIFVHHSCISLSGFRVLPVNTVVRFSVAVLMNTVQAVDVIPLGPQWPLPSLPPSACPTPLLLLLTGKQTQQRQIPPPCVQPPCTTTTTACKVSCMSEPPAYVLPEAAAMVWRHHKHYNHYHISNTHSSSSGTHDSGNAGSSSSSSGGSVCEKGLSWAEMAVVPSAAVPNALEAKSTMHVVHLVKNTPSESSSQSASASPQAASHIVLHRNATSDGCDNNYTRGQTKGCMAKRVSVHPTHITQCTSVTSTADTPATVSRHGSLRHASQQPAVMPVRAEQQQQQERKYGEGMMPTQRVTTTTSASDTHAVQAAVRATWAIPASAPLIQDAMAALPHDTPRNVVHAFSSSSFPSSQQQLQELHEGQMCADQSMTCEKEDETSPPRLPFSTAIHARVGTRKATTTTAVDATLHTPPHTEDTMHAATQPTTTTNTAQAAKTATRTTSQGAVVMTTTKGLHGGARTGNGEERGGTNTTTTMQGGASSSAPQDNSRSGTKPRHTHTTTTTTMSASQYPMREVAGTHAMATSKTLTTRHGDLQANGDSAEVRLETGSEDRGRHDEVDNSRRDNNADNRNGCRYGEEETSGAAVRCVMGPQAASQLHYHSSRGEGNTAEQEIRHVIHIPSDTQGMTAVTQPEGNDTHLHHLQQQQRDVHHEGVHDRRGSAPVTDTTTTAAAVLPLQVATSVEATGTLSQPVTPSHRVPLSAHGPLHTTQSDEEYDKKAEKGWNEQQSHVPLPSSSPTTMSSSSSSSSAPASVSPVDSIKDALLRFVTPLMQPRPTTTTTTTPTDPKYHDNINETEEDRMPVDVTQQQQRGDDGGNVVADAAAASSSSSSPVRRTRPVSEEEAEDNDNDEMEGEGSPTEMASVSNGSGTHTSGETQLGSNPNSSPDWTEVFDQKIANERMKDMLFHKQALKSFPQYNNNNHDDNSSSKGNDEVVVAAVWEVRVGEGAAEQQAAASSSLVPHEERVYTDQQQQQQPYARRVPQHVQDVTTTTATTAKDQAVRRKEATTTVVGQADTQRNGDRERSEGRGQHVRQPLPSHTQGNTAPQPFASSSCIAVPHTACKPVPNTTMMITPAKEIQHASGSRKTAGANTASPTKADEATHLPSSLASPWLQKQQKQSYGVTGAEGHRTQAVPKRTRTKAHTTDAITPTVHVVPSHSDPHMRNTTTRPTITVANTTMHASPPCHHDINSPVTSPAADVPTNTPITAGGTSHSMCAVDDAMASLCVIAVHRLPPSLAAQVPAGVGCIALPRATVEALGLLSHDISNSNAGVGERDAHAVSVRPPTATATEQEGQRVEETQASHGAMRDTTPGSVTRVATSPPMAEDNTRTTRAMGDRGNDTAVAARMQDVSYCEAHKNSQNDRENTHHKNNNNNAMRNTASSVPVNEAVTTPSSDALAAAVVGKDHTPPPHLMPSSQGSSPDMLLFLSPTQQQQQKERSSSGGGMWAEANTQSSSHSYSHHPQMRFTSSASGESEQDGIHPSSPSAAAGQH